MVVTIILLIIITIITLFLQIYNYTGWKNRLTINNSNGINNVEGFQACYSSNGKMTMVNNSCGYYNNMNNKGRINGGNRGPIVNFHQCFTNNQIPELSWRANIEKQLNNGNEVAKLDGIMLQPNSDAVKNVYENVNY